MPSIPWTPSEFRLILTYDRCVMLVSIKAGMCLGDGSGTGWCFRNPASFHHIKPIVSNGINYQPQRVTVAGFSAINSISDKNPRGKHLSEMVQFILGTQDAFATIASWGGGSLLFGHCQNPGNSMGSDNLFICMIRKPVIQLVVFQLFGRIESMVTSPKVRK